MHYKIWVDSKKDLYYSFIFMGYIKAILTCLFKVGLYATISTGAICFLAVASYHSYCYLNSKNIQLMHLVSSNGSVEQIHNALASGANPNTSALSPWRESALHRAVTRGNLEVVQLLLEKHNANPNVRRLYGKTPLDLAIDMASHNPDLLEEFLEIIDLLLRSGAHLNALTPDDNTSPLYRAISTGSSKIVQMLLEAGADPDLLNYKNYSPLYWAIYHREIEIVKILLEANANINHLIEKFIDTSEVQELMALENPIGWITLPKLFLAKLIQLSIHNISELIELIEPIKYPFLTGSLVLSVKNSEDPRGLNSLNAFIRAIPAKQVLPVFYAKKILYKFFNYHNIEARKNLALLQNLYLKIKSPPENKLSNKQKLEEEKFRVDANLLKSLQPFKFLLNTLSNECSNFDSPTMQHLREEYEKHKTLFQNLSTIGFIHYCREHNQGQARSFNLDSQSSSMQIDVQQEYTEPARHSVSEESKPSFAKLYLFTNKGSEENKEKTHYREYIIHSIVLLTDFYKHLQHLIDSQGDSLESDTIFKGKEILSNEDLLWLENLE